MSNSTSNKIALRTQVMREAFEDTLIYGVGGMRTTEDGGITRIDPWEMLEKHTKSFPTKRKKLKPKLPQ